MSSGGGLAITAHCVNPRYEEPPTVANVPVNQADPQPVDGVDSVVDLAVARLEHAARTETASRALQYDVIPRAA